MPNYRLIPHLEAMRINVLLTKVQTVELRRQLKHHELRALDHEAERLQREVVEILRRSGFSPEESIGRVYAEEDDGYPAGAVLRPDGTPYLLAPPAAPEPG